jgi:hypothetical protein
MRYTEAENAAPALAVAISDAAAAAAAADDIGTCANMQADALTIQEQQNEQCNTGP